MTTVFQLWFHLNLRDDDVEDLDLLLEGSVRHDADVENTEETVDVTLAVRH